MQAVIPQQKAGVVELITTLVRCCCVACSPGDGPFAKRHSLSHVVMSLLFDLMDRILRHERSIDFLVSTLDVLLLGGCLCWRLGRKKSDASSAYRHLKHPGHDSGEEKLDERRVRSRTLARSVRLLAFRHFLSSSSVIPDISLSVVVNSFRTELSDLYIGTCPSHRILYDYAHLCW